MQEPPPQLAYRLRTATSDDDAALRAAIGVTLAHPGADARRASYRGAAGTGDLLVLERYDRQERVWHVGGFLEFRLRVDDTLSIRDAGTTGDTPNVGVLRYMLDELFSSTKPAAAQVKIRRDAIPWQDVFRNVAGFYLEGEEYRRPHYWTIWRWDPARARAERAAAAAPPRPPRAPQPPPPRPPAPARSDGPGSRRGGPEGGGRPNGPAGRRPDGPRPGGPFGSGGPRPPRST
ncbi:MAG: hypothetical protein HYX52_06960 [Chloroflexi bacterium]|nr:hypothetical protein [Chloroflexota bacterium]